MKWSCFDSGTMPLLQRFRISAAEGFVTRTSVFTAIQHSVKHSFVKLSTKISFELSNPCQDVAWIQSRPVPASVALRTGRITKIISINSDMACGEKG